METEEKGSENQRISLETPERKSTEQKEQREVFKLVMYAEFIKLKEKSFKI